MEQAFKYIQVGYGSAKGTDSFSVGVEAAKRAIERITTQKLSAVLVFASISYQLQELLMGINSVVGDFPVFGTTTAGEICNKPLHGSVVVIVLASPHLRVRMGIGKNVSKGWLQAVQEAIGSPEIKPYFSGIQNDIWPSTTRQGKSIFSLCFSPGNTKHDDSRSYEILEELKRLSSGHIPFFGGSSADDWEMETNYILYGTNAYPDSLLVAIFETSLRFGMSMDHGFSPSNRRAVATKVSGHEVVELDGKRAADVYAQMLGSDPEELKDKHLTLTSGQPCGIHDMLDQYRINVASYFTPEGKVRFAQPLTEDTTVTIMEAQSDSLIKAGRETLRKALLRGQISRPAIALVFSCALRQRILKDDLPEEIESMRSLLPKLPIIGFYSFGEQGITDSGVSCHANESITVLAFGDELTASAEVAYENQRLLKQQRENEAFLEAIVENIPHMVFVKDAENLRFARFNKAGEEMIGYSREELIGKNDYDFFPKEQADFFTTQDKIVLDKKTLVDIPEEQIETKYKGKRILHTKKIPLLDEKGQPKYLLGISEDITTRKRAEEALQTSAEQYRTMTSTSMDGFAVVDVATARLLDVNDAYSRMIGYSRDELLTMSVSNIVVGETPDDIRKRLQIIMSAGSSRFESRHRCKDGRIADVEVSSTFLPQTGRFLVFLRDITERKRSEVALQTSAEQYRIMTSTSMDGFAVVDVATARLLDVNDAYSRMIGYSRDELLTMSVTDIEAVATPEEIRKQHEKTMTESSDRFESRHRCRNGRIIDVEVSMTYLSPTGHILIFLRDITKRKRAEEALKSSQKRLEEAMDLAFMANWEYDVPTDIFTFNDRFYTLYGTTANIEGGYQMPSDVYAKEFVHPDDHYIVAEEVQKAIEATDSDYESRLEHRIVRRDGEIRHIIVSYGIMKDENGNTIMTYGVNQDITERKKIHEALQNSRAFLSSLVKTIPDLVWLKDSEGIYLACNSRFESFFGAKEEDIVGKTDYDFVDKRLADFFRDHDKRAMAKGRPSLNEEEITFADDGHSEILETIKTPMFRSDGQLVGVLGIGRDITQRKQAEEELRKSEERFRMLSQSAFEGVVIHDEGYIIDANDQFYKMFGYMPEELDGMNAIELTVTPDSIRTMKTRIASRDSGPYEVTGMNKDGTQFPIEIRARLMESHGRTARMAAIRDLSERKAVEKERKELESRLRQAQKMEAIGTLAGGIAHDFNNVLGIIVGNVELASDDVPEGSSAHLSLKEARQACVRAKDMVKQILAFSRQQEKQLIPIDIYPIVKEVMKMLRATIPTTIEIQQDASTKKAMILGDPTQIHQVLMNLCTNAAQAMDEMGGVLQVRLASVYLDKDVVKILPGLSAGRYIRLTVSDTGHGMDPNILSRVFEPYFTTKEVGIGTGMGLATVHGIVKQHGGEVTVYSEVNKGTTFHVFLPELKREHEEQEVAEEIVPIGDERILFVDDEVALASLGRRMLESLGYRVESRTSSIEALEAFRNNPDKFDLVVTDMTMPNMTGEFLAKELIHIRPSIPVIICTGFSHKINEEKANSIGIKGFLMKPLVRSELAWTVRKVLDNK